MYKINIENEIGNVIFIANYDHIKDKLDVSLDEVKLTNEMLLLISRKLEVEYDNPRRGVSYPFTFNEKRFEANLKSYQLYVTLKNGWTLKYEQETNPSGLAFDFGEFLFFENIDSNARGLFSLAERNRVRVGYTVFQLFNRVTPDNIRYCVNRLTKKEIGDLK
jgi:hypothetical protein